MGKCFVLVNNIVVVVETSLEEILFVQRIIMIIISERPDPPKGYTSTWTETKNNNKKEKNRFYSWTMLAAYFGSIFFREMTHSFWLFA